MFVIVGGDCSSHHSGISRRRIRDDIWRSGGMHTDNIRYSEDHQEIKKSLKQTEATTPLKLFAKFTNDIMREVDSSIGRAPHDRGSCRFESCSISFILEPNKGS